MEKKKVFKIIVFTVNIIYTIGALYFIYINNIKKVIFIILCMLSSFLVMKLNRKYNELFSYYIGLTVIVFIMFSILFGTCFKFYNIFSRYDDFLHLWSGFISSAIAYSLFINLGKYQVDNNMRKIFFVIYIIIFAVGVGGLWELIEFFMDKAFATHCQGGGLVDTMEDIFDALLGSIIITTHYIAKGVEVIKQDEEKQN